MIRCGKLLCNRSPKYFVTSDRVSSHLFVFSQQGGNPGSALRNTSLLANGESEEETTETLSSFS